MSAKPLSVLGVSSVSVSVELADMNYGSGEKNFMSISSKIPDGAEGLPLDMETVMGDGLDKYFAAWQTLLQAALASGRISQTTYVKQTELYLSRIKKVRALYKKITDVRP